MMRLAPLLTLVLVSLLTPIGLPCRGGLSPNDVLVVYNADSTRWPGSRAAANYYCAARGIPARNQLGILSTWNRVTEDISPAEFGQFIWRPLMEGLIAHFGADPSNPDSCSIRCIVLCYGIPTRVTSATRLCSVDSALSTLFEEAPWGRLAVASTVGCVRDGLGISSSVPSPYCDSGGTNYLSARGSKPIDFSQFRASSYNDGTAQDQTENPPNFTVVRFIDDSHAVAGGEQGMLYRGELSGGNWTWTATKDEDKDLVAHTISSIVVCPNNLWACTGVPYQGGTEGSGGTILLGSRSAASWDTSRTAPMDWGPAHHNPAPVDTLYQASFCDDTHGWVAGRHTLGSSTPILLKTTDGSTWETVSGLPSELATGIGAVAAPDADRLWIGGYAGLYSLEGGTWVRKTTATNVNRLGACKSGDSITAWAVGNNGLILHYTDALGWHTDTYGETCPAGAVKLTDLSVTDASHAAIAYGASSFLKWHADQNDPCGGHWELDSSDPSPKASVAIDTQGNCLAVSGSTIRYAVDTGAGLSWQQSYYSIPQAHWRMRFLVCRLDGYASPTVATPYGEMPSDVKAMIDRSVLSDGTGWDNGVRQGDFVLDYVSWRNQDRNPLAADNLASLVALEPADQDYGTAYLIGRSNVMGYFSEGANADGSYADPLTTFGRPFNSWRPGSIGVYGDGFEALQVRTPQFVNTPAVTGPGPQGRLRVVLKGVDFASLNDTITNSYAKLLVRLYSAQTRQVLAEQSFALEKPNPSDYNSWVVAAEIPLTGAYWGEGNPKMQVEFPTGPPEDMAGFAGQCVRFTDFAPPLGASVLNEGVTYQVDLDHSRCAEMIREGASATVGCVHEPGGVNGDQMHGHYYSFPRYAMGLTLAEAAHLGISDLGQYETVFGDPLMAPYAKAPTITMTSPPTEGAPVSGTIATISGSALDSQGTPEISCMEAWVTSAFGSEPTAYAVSDRVGYSTGSASLSCSFDTTALLNGSPRYPNGLYDIRITAYDSSAVRAAHTLIRRVCVNNGGSPTTVQLNSPSEGSRLAGAVTISAAAAAPLPARMELWVYGGVREVLVGTLVSEPYSLTFNTTTLPDGDYFIQAIGCAADGRVSVSAARPVVIDNSALVTVSAPSNVTGSFIVTAAAEQTVEHIDATSRRTAGGN